MKTTQIPIEPKDGLAQPNPPVGPSASPGFPPRTERSCIQWPTAQELRRISTSLAEVSRTGMRQEGAGDYFNSGDLAYQLQEIIRAAAALLKKSQRINS